MTYSPIRKKNLIFLLDGLWGTNFEQNKPVKWQMAPFNNTYSSSVFASLDNVAIESVGYDFLRSEFTIARSKLIPNTTAYPNANHAFVQMRGLDDYLHQAADSTNWPKGIKYDPDSSGVHIYSLGVHEHWNNATEKKYTRNLGTGNGIELFSVEQGKTTGVASQESIPNGFELYQNYPNPFNPTTKITYSLPTRSSVSVTIYDIQGKTIKSYSFNAQSAGSQSVVWNGTNNYGQTVSSGIYLYRVTVSSLKDGNRLSKSAKMILLK
jgi:hypothetical protein